MKTVPSMAARCPQGLQLFVTRLVNALAVGVWLAACPPDPSPEVPQETCVADTVYCDNTIVKKCGPDGVVSSSVPCLDARFCVDGRCDPAVLCHPGASLCVTNVLMVCAADGQHFSSETKCDNRICVNGDCLDPVGICPPGASYCKDNTAYRCNAEGSALAANPEQCGEALCVNGQCLERVCDPGSASCDEQTARRCNLTGTAWFEQTPCADDQLCVLGSCDPRICEPDAFRCNGRWFERCNHLGTALIERVSCDPGVCTPAGCEPMEAGAPADALSPPEATVPDAATPDTGNPDHLAPTTIHSDPEGYGHPGANFGGRPMARDRNGRLYLAYADRTTADAQNDRLFIKVSGDNGSSWTMLTPGHVNNEYTGAANGSYIYHSSLAIDAGNKLHVYWGVSLGNNNFAQGYRRFDLTSRAWTEIERWNYGSRTFGYPMLALDSQGYLHALHAGLGWWNTALKRSVEPLNTDAGWDDLGLIATNDSTFSGSAHSGMVVDAEDNIHVFFSAYYQSARRRFHRWYDGTNWHENEGGTAGHGLMLSTETAMIPDGLTAVVSCADALGHVHTLFGERATLPSDAGTTYVPRWVYRRWSRPGATGEGVWATAGSSGYTIVTSCAREQLEHTSGTDDSRLLALSCDEASGRVYLVYRDIGNAAGAFLLAYKDLDDPTFTVTDELGPPSSALNTYYAPSGQQTLWPAFNRSDGTHHFVWRQGSAAPFALRHLRLNAR